jgi:hypothetical protein
VPAKQPRLLVQTIQASRAFMIVLNLHHALENRRTIAVWRPLRAAGTGLVGSDRSR